jgi:hypothetical protein
VKLRCRKEDTDVIKSVIADAQKEYSEFVKRETGQDMNVKIEVVETVPLEEKDTK